MKMKWKKLYFQYYLWFWHLQASVLSVSVGGKDEDDSSQRSISSLDSHVRNIFTVDGHVLYLTPIALTFLMSVFGIDCQVFNTETREETF